MEVLAIIVATEAGARIVSQTRSLVLCSSTTSPKLHMAELEATSKLPYKAGCGHTSDLLHAN